MPTTTLEDFTALQGALEKNNIEDLKKILLTFDVNATGDSDRNCLAYGCRFSSSTEVIQLVFEKILNAGSAILLKRQLTATNKDGYNCAMFASRNSASAEAVKFVFAKLVQVGGTALLKSQLIATSDLGSNCLALCCRYCSSPKVLKLLAAILFEFDLFKMQHSNLGKSDKDTLKQMANIEVSSSWNPFGSSWAPDPASVAEVKEILQVNEAGGLKKSTVAVEEATAAAKKKAEEEATAKKADENAALAKKMAEEEDAAKKKAHDEEAALAKKRAEEEASSQQPTAQQQEVQTSVSFGSAPPSRCFKRGVPDKNLEDAIRALLSIKEAPSNRPDLKNWIPDKNDGDDLLHYLNCNLAGLKNHPAINKLIAENGLTDVDIKILHSYKIQNPYPVYLWLNGWLGGDRRDDFVKENVAPFFVLLYRAMEKLPRVTTSANRAIKVNGIPALKNTYDNHKTVCVKGAVLSFWGFSSFSTEDDVVNREEFVGKPSEEAILYSCGELQGVDMEPFSPKGLKNESEILPLCPCVLEVVTTIKVGQKLVVAVKQADHANFAYVAPK